MIGPTPASSPRSEIDVQYKRVGRQGTITLTIITPDDRTYSDKLDITKESVRAKLLERVSARLGPDVASLLDAEFEEIASAVVEQNAADGGEKSQADELVDLVAEVQLFHTPGGHDSDGYAAIECDGHREVWPIGSRAFKRWLSRKHYEVHGKVPGSQALQDALTVIAGKAIYEGPEHEVSVRIARVGAAIYLDLADTRWRVVEITCRGWRIISGRDALAWFVRKPGMLALPDPVSGGSVEELRPLLNIPDERAWVLLIACIVAYLRGKGPYPILIIDGEQGSAKSTLCRIVLLLIDPRKAGLRRPPREERDLMIAAANSLIVGFDNLSGLPSWISDALCSLATGGGFSTRALYTDDEEKVFDAMRPVLLNGIDNVAGRSDLLDRAVHMHLPTIPEERRMPETLLWKRFDSIHARVLGALLGAAVHGLRNEDTVRLTSYPRMADFAIWASAAEEALGWKPGAFIAAYAGNRQEAHELAIESSPIGGALLAFMRERVAWEGTPKELRATIEAGHADDRAKSHRDWPKTPEAMRWAVKRIATDLRAIGISVEFPPRSSRGRLICLAWTSGTSPALRDGSSQGHDGSSTDDRHAQGGPGGPERATSAGHVGHDGSLPTQSSGDDAEVVEWSI